jgi:hypothetical protein
MSKAATKAIVRRKTRATLTAFVREDKLAGLPAPYRKTKLSPRDVKEALRAVMQ